MTDRVGQQLGNYRLIRLLGQGGFAEVYLGEHVLLKTAAAIKVLHTQFQQTVIDSFLQEAQAIEQLRHSHIVRFLDFGQDSGDRTFFLVMEYAPHGSLRELHPRGVFVNDIGGQFLIRIGARDSCEHVTAIQIWGPCDNEKGSHLAFC